MKILVLGGTGMVGHTVALYLKEVGHNLTVLSRKKISYCKNINQDIKNFNYLKHEIIEGKYDAIINAIGILNKEAEQSKADSVLLNSYLPHFLSDETKTLKTKIIHISTDCVFSGKIGNYSENSLKDGETFYDRSKALGELENNKDLTFRNSVIGPDLNERGIGLFNWFMKQNAPIIGFSNVIWTGVTTLTLAKAINQALVDNITGVYHLVNNSTISKYELLNLFNKHMKKNKIEIIPDEKLSTNKSLINNRKDFSFKVPNYETMISEMSQWIKIHIEYYPHYNNANNLF